MAIIEFIRHVLEKWRKDRTSRMAAALAYYSVFLVAPLVVILVAIAADHPTPNTFCQCAASVA